MLARKNKNLLPGPRALTAAALTAFTSSAAWAQETIPWYVGVSQSLTRDSNVYRLSDGVAPINGESRSDTYSSTGLLGGFDQPYGRQRFRAVANVRYNKYQDQDRLDNTSYGLDAGWDWSTIWNLSGGVNVSANQSLAQLNGNSAVPTTTRNLVKTDQIGANVNWGGTGLLSVQSTYSHSRARYSDQNSGNSNSSGDSASLGAYYSLSPAVTTGLALRFTRTDATAANQNSSNGRNLDLSANWRYSPQTGANARLSWTRQSNSGSAGQEFSGLTGSLAANYAPTAKLGFNISYNRDAGTNGTFFNVPDTGGSTTAPVLFENSQVSDSLALGASYAATAKISATAGYQYRKAKISNTAASGGASAGFGDYDDKLQTASLGVGWAISRGWQLGCNFLHEKRDVTSTPGYAYTANVIGCSASLSLR